MEDAITELDKAVSGEDDPSAFAEEHPDAPEWAGKMAARLDENAAKLAEHKRKRKARLERLQRDLEERVAAMALDAGAATDEEKQVAKAAAEENSNPTDLQQFFTPRGELRGDQ